MSRVYDALKKLEEQGREVAQEQPAAAAKTSVVPPRKMDEFLAAPALPVRVASEDRIVVHSDRRSAGAERFRLIRMALRNAFAGKSQKVLLITSPLSRDGKSTVALNLATSLADQGKVKVLLLEADLHRPSLLAYLGVDGLKGLADVVEGAADPATAIRRIEPLGFYLLPAGNSPEHPAELLQSERFHGLLRDVKASFDWVLIDCPPAFPLSDVVALSPHADGVLLVVRAGVTPREAVLETAQLFKPGQIVGMVLNASESLNSLYSEYYYRRSGTELSDLSKERAGDPRLSSKGLSVGRRTEN